MPKAPRTKRRKGRKMGKRDPHYFTQAGPVTVRHADGTSDEAPAYAEDEYQRIVRVRANVKPSTRQAIERRDKVCRYCGTDAGPFEIDHVVPIAMGGSNRMGNLVLACRPCNQEKHASVWTPKKVHP